MALERKAVRSKCEYTDGLEWARDYIKLDAFVEHNGTQFLERHSTMCDVATIFISLFNCAAADQHGELEAFDDLHMVITPNFDVCEGLQYKHYFDPVEKLLLIDPVSKQLLPAFAMKGWHYLVASIKAKFQAHMDVATMRFNGVRHLEPGRDYYKLHGKPSIGFAHLLHVAYTVLHDMHFGIADRIVLRNVYRGLVKEAYDHPQEFAEFASEFDAPDYYYVGKEGGTPALQARAKAFHEHTKRTLVETTWYAKSVCNTKYAREWLRQPRMAALTPEPVPPYMEEMIAEERSLEAARVLALGESSDDEYFVTPAA